MQDGDLIYTRKDNDYPSQLDDLLKIKICYARAELSCTKQGDGCQEEHSIDSPISEIENSLITLEV